MGREHGSCGQAPEFTVDVFNTREHGLWTRAPVHTTRVHGPYGREHGPCWRALLKKALSCNAFFNRAMGVKNVNREHG